MPQHREHEPSYPVRRKTVEERALSISRVFSILLPVVLSILGLVMLIAVAVVPRLQNPALIASMTGLLSVISAVAYARRESK